MSDRPPTGIQSNPPMRWGMGVSGTPISRGGESSRGCGRCSHLRRIAGGRPPRRRMDTGLRDGWRSSGSSSLRSREKRWGGVAVGEAKRFYSLFVARENWEFRWWCGGGGRFGANCNPMPMRYAANDSAEVLVRFSTSNDSIILALNRTICFFLLIQTVRFFKKKHTNNLNLNLNLKLH